MEAMQGLQGLSEEQRAELKRLQVLTEGLLARAVRPKTPQLSILIQGDEHQQQQHGGGGASGGGANGRSLRNDPGCNILFEQLVLEMGYDAEAARQAIMALPGSIMDEIIDYIVDKEAIFESWRRFKAALLVKK
jgi:hypothetical protein